MSSVKTYYLIDFENVKDEGLLGSNTLGPNDYIHLFYTDNVKKINLDILNANNSCSISYHKVPIRNQSLDMHLVSYLGYLIGIHKEKKCKYVIISKDTDYDNIINFWKNSENACISRQPQIIKDNKKTTIVLDKQDFNNIIQKKLSEANFTGDIVNYVASLVCKNCNKEKPKQLIYNAIISKYGQSQGLNIYNHIKKSL